MSLDMGQSRDLERLVGAGKSGGWMSDAPCVGFLVPLFRNPKATVGDLTGERTLTVPVQTSIFGFGAN